MHTFTRTEAPVLIWTPRVGGIGCRIDEWEYRVIGRVGGFFLEAPFVLTVTPRGGTAERLGEFTTEKLAREYAERDYLSTWPR